MMARAAEDEEISEDGAFDSEDERRYGDVLDAIARRQQAAGLQGRRQPGKQVEEEEEDLDDEQGATLLDMIKDDDDEEEEEEEDGDKASVKSSSSEASSGSSDSSESASESESGSQDAMLDLVDQMVDKAKRPKRTKELVELANASSTSSNTTKDQKLSLDQLVSSLNTQDQQGKFASLQRRMEQLQGAKTIKEPLARVVAERAERKVAYENAKTEGAETWNKVVAEHQEKRTQQFPLNLPARTKATTGAIAAKFEPTTPLETEIDRLLKDSGLADETRVKEDEQKHMLEVNQVDPEEMRKRQKELAKLRALMFYGEQKARRAKKIKSKMYRKLKRKRNARQEEKELEELRKVDPEAVKAMEAKAAYQRVKERMTLKHKNTSKFIRGLLKHGGARKEYTRDIITEQLNEERRLRRRVKTLADDDDSDDDDSDGGPDCELRAAAKLSQEVAEPAPKPTKGLFALKFMQKGLERQREQAQQEAKTLMDALREGDDPSNPDKDEDQVVGKRSFGPQAKALEDDKTEEEPQQQQQQQPNGPKTKTNNSEKSSSNKDNNNNNNNNKTKNNKRRRVVVDATKPDTHVNPWLEGKSSKDQQPVDAQVQVKIQKVVAVSEQDKQANKEQAELIKRAFAGTDQLQKDFQDQVEQDEQAPQRALSMAEKPGWGEWAGAGVAQPRATPPVPPPKKKRKKTKQVVVSTKRNKKAAKYLVSSVPYPFTSRAQYEASLQNPLGSDWNTANAFNKSIKPDVITRKGTIIEPLRAGDQRPL